MYNRGIFLGLFAACLFAIMNIIVKGSSEAFDPRLVLFSRGLIGLLLFTPYVKKEIFSLASKKSAFLWCRFLAGSISFYALSANVQMSGAAAGLALAKIEAVFVILLSIVFFKVLPKKIEWIAIVLILLGVYVLYAPILATLHIKTIMIGLIGALFGGIALISLKKSAHAFSPLLIVWGLCFTSILISFTLPSSKGFSSMNTVDLALLGLVGVLGTLGQVFLTKSYGLLSAPIASMVNLSSIVWCILFEIALSGSLPNMMSLFGYGFIILGLVSIQVLPYFFNKQAPTTEKG